MPARNEPRPVAVAFVGRLVREKGIYDVIDALRRCTNAMLTVVGDGPERAAMVRRCDEAGLTVEFLGVQSIEAIPEILAAIDVLVLPSIAKDGWGAVVSEALLAGCAVITTTEVGASMLLSVPGIGVLVKSHSPEAIARAIDMLRDSGALDASARRARRIWAEGCLTGSAGAAHMLGIINWANGQARRPEPFYLNCVAMSAP